MVTLMKTLIWHNHKFLDKRFLDEWCGKPGMHIKEKHVLIKAITKTIVLEIKKLHVEDIYTRCDMDNCLYVKKFDSS